MPAIVSSKFRIHNAQQFTEAFGETSNTIMYFYLGGPSSFASDSSPPTPTNSTANVEYLPWHDMIAVKRVTSSDVSLAAPRYDWTSSVVYDQYDDTDTNLIESDDFYVVTDDYNVYKCLFNNGGAASTTKPTGTSTSRFTTADGYVWKYMYTISTGDALKFLTTDYIPVETLDSDDGSNQWDVQAAAVDGAIEIVKVTSGGSGYGSAPSVSIDGDGTGATANATITGDAVTAVTIINAGTGYTRATVSFSGGGGSGANATAIISPKGGHGSNPVEELGAKYVLLNVRLDGSESNTISTVNDFRKVGLVRDPYSYGTSNRATSTNIRQTYRYTISSPTTNYTVDETVTVGSNTATVVEWDSVNNYLYTTKPLNKDFANASYAVGGTSTANGQIIAINTPGLQPYTGDVIYTEFRSPISRSADQIEDVKLIIQF
jgi:hypothetical protein